MVNDSSGTSRHHKVIALSTKIAIIDAVEEGTKLKSAIADSFVLPKSTVSTILKNKEKLRAACEKYKFKPERKKLRTAVYEDIEEALFTWH